MAPNIPYLNLAKLKPYDAKYTVLLANGRPSSSGSFDSLIKAVDYAKQIKGPDVRIDCELRDNPSHPVRLIITLEQAIKITGSPPSP